MSGEGAKGERDQIIFSNTEDFSLSYRFLFGSTIQPKNFQGTTPCTIGPEIMPLTLQLLQELALKYLRLLVASIII